MEAKETPREALVVGASSNPERYSFKAMKALLEAGWRAIPVNPAGGAICGIEALKAVPSAGDVHTVTLYVNAGISSKMSEPLLALKPKRVIFNPGAENPELREKLGAAGIETLEACTLVMLRTGSF